MTDATVRRGGIAAIIAGVWFILWAVVGSAFEEQLPEWTFFPVLVIFLALFLVALFGIRAAHGGREGGLGRAGFFITATGAALLGLLFIYGMIFEATGGNVEEEGPGFVDALLGVGFFGTIIGVLLLGIALIRANVMNRWASWLFTIGLPLGLIVDLATGAFFEENGDTPEFGFFIGPPLFCIGLVWLGYGMWKRRGEASEPGPPPVTAP
jgi:peptidoglycan/LPS O-acetylase OafA/YrhL